MDVVLKKYFLISSKLFEDENSKNEHEKKTSQLALWVQIKIAYNTIEYVL